MSNAECISSSNSSIMTLTSTMTTPATTTAPTLSLARIGWIDAAKGVAILAIMVGHVAAVCMNDLYAAPVAFKLTDTFQVPLFFLLAGYTLRDGCFGMRGIWKLFKRCMIPYFVVGIFCILFCFLVLDDFSLADKTFGFLYGAGAFRDNILFGDTSVVEAIGLIWFLPALFIGKILASAISSIKYLSVRFLVAFVLFLIGAQTADILFLPFDIQQGLCACWFITCGSLLHKAHLPNKAKSMVSSQTANNTTKTISVVGVSDKHYEDVQIVNRKDNENKKPEYRNSQDIHNKVVLVGIISFAILYVWGVLNGFIEEAMYCNSNYHNVFVNMFGSLAVSIFVLWITKTIYSFKFVLVDIINKMFEWCGKHSMTLFSVHAITLACGDRTKWWLQDMIAAGVSSVEVFIVYLLVDIAICVAVTWIIYKFPVPFLHNMFYGKAEKSNDKKQHIIGEKQNTKKKSDDTRHQE